MDQDLGNIQKIQKAIIKVFENSENIFLNNISSDITGEKIFKEVNCLPFCNNSGDVIQVAIVSRDVTEERKKTEQIQNLNLKLQEAVEDGKIKNKKLEETLQHLKETQAQILQSEKMSSIGQLAAGIAHEINNPTGFVSSNLKTLSGYYKDVEGLIARYRNLVKNIQEENHKIDIPRSIKEQSQKITTIEEEIDLEYILDDIKDIITECREGTERIKKIVLDLKDFAHPGEDKIMEADINKGLESTLNVVWNELKYKAVVHKEYGELPMVKCYPQQLNQVFMNILVNAGQAIEKQGEIKITTGTVDGHAVISISDTGIGIPEENLIKIFDPFFTTKEIRKGTGLGMNVAYNIIKKHQGSIDVESEVGRGTTFKIKIPLEETAS